MLKATATVCLTVQSVLGLISLKQAAELVDLQTVFVDKMSGRKHIMASSQFCMCQSCDKMSAASLMQTLVQC